MSFYTGDIMKVTYINHSGFLIETRDCYYIFDYYKGELPHLDKEKEVIVFCSHPHIIKNPKDLWVKMILVEMTAKNDYFFFLVKVRQFTLVIIKNIIAVSGLN